MGNFNTCNAFGQKSKILNERLCSHNCTYTGQGRIIGAGGGGVSKGKDKRKRRENQERSGRSEPLCPPFRITCVYVKLYSSVKSIRILQNISHKSRTLEPPREPSSLQKSGQALFANLHVLTGIGDDLLFDRRFDSTMSGFT